MTIQYVSDFIQHYSMFRFKPSLDEAVTVEGNYQASLSHEQYGEVQINYKLRIKIPEDYPRSLPEVYELSNRIEKKPVNHVNCDGSICLGAPIRLKIVIQRNPSLTNFFEKCILPYLFAITLKLKTGKDFVFGELEHGNKGLIDDFKKLFNLSEVKQVCYMLVLLSKNKREANRLVCPCGCKKRLSTCRYFEKVQQMRKRFSRSEWEEQYLLLKGGC
ncbi:hypothetical protein DV702_05400 [Sporosarcina sp. PTS2304]|uniref:hypothetical protein n=1 Tax=Sporosarcina sp. PTS2304 TaxID=2283194 RepID=UPI000E0CD092|nr:hypothetical protein [Sporosarcina sp. PTS2304]AXH99222.1 hypothetical protein DV702_05400 [Sporosarcina sp. PTS2304]